jgi:hypothetical protein
MSVICKENLKNIIRIFGNYYILNYLNIKNIIL